MPYSLDKEANQENAMSPSEYLTVNEQLMYKLAALDAAVQGGFRRLDEKMDRFQADLHDGQIKTNDRINNLDKETSERFALKRKRIDDICKDIHNLETGRIQKLETWQTVAMAKISVAAAVVSTVIVMFAPAIRHALGVAG